MTDKLCICLNEPLQFDQYETVKSIGVDTINGRYGDVTLKRCKRCDRYWLHYCVEYEAFTGSGRYFMGAIAPETSSTLSPDTAVESILFG